MRSLLNILALSALVYSASAVRTQVLVSDSQPSNMLRHEDCATSANKACATPHDCCASIKYIVPDQPTLNGTINACTPINTTNGFMQETYNGLMYNLTVGACY